MEKSHVHGTIGFGFNSHWLKNWHESFKPITKRSNRSHVISFNSYLNTALVFYVSCKYFNVEDRGDPMNGLGKVKWD